MNARVDLNVRSVSWDSGELTIGYEQPEDLRSVAGMPVLRLSQVTIPLRHPSYWEEAEDLRALAVSLIADVLEDYLGAEPFEVVAAGEVDDDDD